jgi:hypothetical protein
MTAVELAEAQAQDPPQVIVRRPPVSPLRRPRSGRGLFLVEVFSDRWGTYPTPQTGGQVVWALCGMNPTG